MQLEAARSSLPEPQVREVIFEALYVHAIDPDDVLQANLRSVGFDVANRTPEYPCSVLGACLETTAAQLLPGIPQAEAFRKLGHTFVQGILRTLLGKAIGPALFLAGADRVMKRVPGLVKSDFGIDLTATRVSPGVYEVVVAPNTPRWSAEFLAGMFESMVGGARVEPRVRVKPPGDPEIPFKLEISWA